MTLFIFTLPIVSPFIVRAVFHILTAFSMNDVILVATPTRPILLHIQEWGTELYAFL